MNEVGRRHTAHDLAVKEPVSMVPRSKSVANVDMDLAYGEAHPASLGQNEKPDEEEELNGLVAKAKGLLEEAECVQHSAAATIEHLQKNPDAMAAVALTLAEISNLVAKMAPSVLAALKASAPSVFALLASPQFLIAAGVGVGVTIVMFGGYKIIKKLTTGPEQSTGEDKEPAAEVDELLELQSEHLSRVEAWRRGVADAEAMSVGTTADGEFITPTAAAMSGLDLSRPPPSQLSRPYDDEASAAPSRRSRHSRHSHYSRRSHRHEHSDGKKKKKKEKSKKLSNRIRLMFTV